MACIAPTLVEGRLEQYVLTLMNDVRRPIGLPLFTKDDALEDGARCHSQLWRQLDGQCPDPAHQCPGEPNVGARIRAAWAPRTLRSGYENVGRIISVSISEPDYKEAVKKIHDHFMGESARPPYQIDVPGNHHEAIIFPLFSYVGIGVAVDDLTTTVRLTVDFVQP